MNFTHKLKTWPRFFADIKSGTKTFELRKYDRPFAVGDKLILQEYDPETQTYTGQEEIRWVTCLYTSDDLPFGIEKGYCLMGVM